MTSYSVDPQNLGDKGAASGLTLAGFALMALGGSDMADYRKDADRCYELARQMAKTEDLHAFLEMAQTWEKLANLHELSQRLESSGVLFKKPAEE